MQSDQIINRTKPELADLLIEVANNFINVSSEKSDTLINHSLAEIGKLTEADRSYIFCYDLDQKTCSNTYEWCAEGVEAQINELQNVPYEMIPDWVSTHFSGRELTIPDVSALDPEDLIRQLLEPQDIKSLITLPMMKGSTCIGFVGLDSVRSKRNYTEKEKWLLRVFTMMLVSLQDKIDAQRDLSQAIKVAESANQVKSDFIANLSHEIRTPLHSVIGYTDLLQRTTLTDKQQEYLDNASRSAKVLMQTLNQVLDFSKLEAGMMSWVASSTDLLSVINNSVQVIQLFIAEKGLELQTKIDPQTPRFILTDSVGLQQILTNLLSNAVKFTEKGKVELSAEYKADSVSSGTLRFSVRDSGIGITDEQKKNLFRPFSQVNPTNNRRHGGTGLGLLISEMIAKKMNSKIEIDNGQTSGTTFFFDLKVQSLSDERLNKMP